MVKHIFNFAIALLFAYIMLCMIWHINEINLTQFGVDFKMVSLVFKQQNQLERMIHLLGILSAGIVFLLSLICGIYWIRFLNKVHGVDSGFNVVAMRGDENLFQNTRVKFVDIDKILAGIDGNKVVIAVDDFECLGHMHKLDDELSILECKTRKFYITKAKWPNIRQLQAAFIILIAHGEHVFYALEVH